MPKDDKPENDAQASLRENLIAAHEEAKQALDETHARAMAIAAPKQKVIDGNEAAALASISGQKPVRDTSDAPEPATLGAHNDGMPTDENTPDPTVG